MGPEIAGQRVLVVEDEWLIAMGLEMALQDAGCVVVGPIGRLDQALEAARSETFDVALLDVNLRGEHAFPIADILAQRGIPYAFLTGYGRDTLPPRYAQSRILAKPFAATGLVATVKAMIPPH
ncbi:MAG: response regulator [Magnetospirillum sp.]|nr:response regulator [Magnetospirillum sp.]